MREHFLRLGKQTAVYGVGAVAQQVLGVITLPIYARVFDPSQYGVIEVITVGLAVLSIFVDLGLGSAAQRSYFDYGANQAQERRVVLSSSIGPSVMIAVTLGALIAVARLPVSVWLFGTGRYANVVALAAVCVPFVTLATLLREVMRVRFQAWRYLGSSLLSGAAGASLGVLFVLVFHMGINGVFAGVLAGNALAAGYGLVISLPQIGRRISGRELRVMAAYALPLVPMALAMWMLQFVDRILLTKLGSLAQVGQYAIANRLALILLLLLSAFDIAYIPFMLSLHAQDEQAERQVRARLLTYVTAALVVVAVVMALFAREIISVIAPRFDQSYKVVGLVCAGMVALGISQLTVAGLTITRRTRLIGLYATIAALVNIGLNVLLIPAWGQIGAGAATVVGYVLMTSLYYRGSQRFYPTEYEILRVIAIAVLGAVLMPIGLLITGSVWLDILAKLGGLVVLGIGLRVLGVIGRDELAEIRRLINRARSARPVSV
jgi:O-antigen/teichoic acid export membrane protein